MKMRKFHAPPHLSSRGCSRRQRLRRGEGREKRKGHEYRRMLLAGCCRSSHSADASCNPFVRAREGRVEGALAMSSSAPKSSARGRRSDLFARIALVERRSNDQSVVFRGFGRVFRASNWALKRERIIQCSAARYASAVCYLSLSRARVT